MIWFLNLLQFIVFLVAMGVGWLMLTALWDEGLPKGLRWFYSLVGSSLGIAGFIGVLLYAHKVWNF